MLLHFMFAVNRIVAYSPWISGQRLSPPPHRGCPILCVPRVPIPDEAGCGRKGWVKQTAAFITLSGVFRCGSAVSPRCRFPSFSIHTCPILSEHERRQERGRVEGPRGCVPRHADAESFNENGRAM